MSDDRMPKADLSRLNESDKEFIRRLQEKNIERVERLRRVRRNNLWTAGFLGLGIIGIYSYTIYAVKQETFLDDFNEPEKTVN